MEYLSILENIIEALESTEHDLDINYPISFSMIEHKIVKAKLNIINVKLKLRQIINDLK